jgi:hypothetical protein
MSKIKLYYWALKRLFESDVRAGLDFMNLREKLYENIIFNYLLRYIPKKVDQGLRKKNLVGIPVFQYWSTGLDNAPEIVRFCVNSVKKNTLNMHHIEINDMNFDQFVEVPAQIKTKYAKGKISPTHFSEILRFALLSNYGGFWIDSTVYLSGEIENYARDPFFAFSTTPKYLMGDEKLSFSSWFLYSERNGIYVQYIYQMLINYWLSEGRYLHRYYLHYCMTHVLKALNKDKNITTNDFESNVLSHYLQIELQEKTHVERLKTIVAKTKVHKLSYYSILKEHQEKYFRNFQMLRFL